MSSNPAASVRKAYDGVVVACRSPFPTGAIPRTARTGGSAARCTNSSAREAAAARHRRPLRVQLHARPDTAVGSDPAFRPVAALARPYADGRRLRHRRAAPRGARRAGGRRRYRRLRRRRHQPVDSFRQMLPASRRFAQDAVYPYGAGGPNACFALLTDDYMRPYGATREDFGKHLRRAAPKRAGLPARADAAAADARGSISPRGRSPIRSTCSTASCPAPAPRHSWSARRHRALARACRRRAARHDRAAQCVSRRSDPVPRRLGDGRRRTLRHGRRRAGRLSISSRPTTTIR